MGMYEKFSGLYLAGPSLDQGFGYATPRAGSVAGAEAGASAAADSVVVSEAGCANDSVESVAAA